MAEPILPPPAADAEVLNAPPDVEVRFDTAARLGQIAHHLTTVAAELGDTSRAVPIDALRTGERALHNIAGAIALIAEGDVAAAVAAYAVLPAPSFARDHKGLARETYPDIPFYNGIVLTDIPPVDPPSPEDEIIIHVISSTHIAINGQVVVLEGEELYMFNALLAHRDEPVSMAVLLEHGFRQSTMYTTTRQRFRAAVSALYIQFARVLPKGVEPIITVKQTKRLHLRRLSPRFVIKDVRGDPTFAYLVPTSLETIDARQSMTTIRDVSDTHAATTVAEVVVALANDVQEGEEPTAEVERFELPPMETVAGLPVAEETAAEVVTRPVESPATIVVEPAVPAAKPVVRTGLPRAPSSWTERHARLTERQHGHRSTLEEVVARLQEHGLVVTSDDVYAAARQDPRINDEGGYTEFGVQRILRILQSPPQP